MAVAHNGKHGLETAREFRPDLIVSDIMMPEMDGFELCLAVKSDPSLEEIPIVLLTSLSTPEDILRGLQVGADSYVSKPYDEAVLLARIRAVEKPPFSFGTPIADGTLQFVMRGKSYSINSNRRQIVNLLLSTYEDIILQNNRLREMRTKLMLLNEQLEKIVEERTASLKQEIVERKKAQSALARNAKELSMSNAELEQFAYVASHDLQEPLRIVAGATQYLAKRYKGRLDADADEFIGYAVNGVGRMRKLISDLLDYSRVGTRGKKLRPTDCGEVLAETLENLRRTIEDNEAVVTHSPLPVVMADPTQIGRLFQNLIANAIKFRGGVAPKVHVSAEKGKGHWIISVTDNGIGIDPEHTEMIFEVFQRLHTDEEYPGTGIGLAICKKIVERHGGMITVESKPGRGATFRFSMPAVREEPTARSDSRSEASKPHNQADKASAAST